MFVLPSALLGLTCRLLLNILQSLLVLKNVLGKSLYLTLWTLVLLSADLFVLSTLNKMDGLYLLLHTLQLDVVALYLVLEVVDPANKPNRTLRIVRWGVL